MESTQPTTQPAVSTATVVPRRRVAYAPEVLEVKHLRREQSRPAVRKAIRSNFGEDEPWRHRCLVSRLPLEHGHPIRVLLLARDEDNHDADPRCYRRVERWLPVGLPLRARYRFGDDGFFPPAKDVAWRALEEYFRTRYGVRLHHRNLPEQLLFNSRLAHPPAAQSTKEVLAVFDFAYVLEDAYRWLVDSMGEVRLADGRSAREQDLHGVRRWAASVKRNTYPAYRSNRPFREHGDEQVEALTSILSYDPDPTRVRTPGWNESVERYHPPCSSALRHQAGGVGLGPVLHQMLRGNGAATRAMCDANLFITGLAELPQPLRPTWLGGFSVHLSGGVRLPDDPAWLQRRRAEWLVRQPMAKPIIGMVR